MRKQFIVFEGLDHVGKTTQLDMAETYLRLRGQDVVRFREPGGTEVGERIRALLLEKREDGVDLVPRAELMLFFASRIQLLDTKIIPSLKEGKTVLLDRYYYSSAAYQGPFVSGVRGPEWVLNMAEEWLRLEDPDRVIYLDGDPELLAKRAAGGVDRIEAKGVEFQKTVRQAYLAMADHRQHLFISIDAMRSVDQVWFDVQKVLDEALEGK